MDEQRFSFKEVECQEISYTEVKQDNNLTCIIASYVKNKLAFVYKFTL